MFVFIVGGVGVVGFLMLFVDLVVGYLGWFGLEILSGFLVGVVVGLMFLLFLGVFLMVVIWLVFCLIMVFGLVGGWFIDFVYFIKIIVYVEFYFDFDDKLELVLKELEVLKVFSD